MACDAFKTVNPTKTVTLTSFSVGSGIGMNAESAIIPLAQAAIEGGSFTCGNVGGVFDGLLAQPTISYTPDASVINPFTVANFSLVAGGANGTIIVQVSINGVNVGFVTCTFTGGVPVFDGSHCTWNSPLTAGAMQTLSCIVDASSSGDQINYSLTFPAITAFNTTQDYVNCAVPICNFTPRPTVGAAIKSANYTRLFNPLGLLLKDI